MSAPTESYVDPANGNDTTGNGTIGTPWKSVQKALDTVTKSTANGNRINIKAGTADVLSATLSFATYGAGGNSAPLILQGYTSAAGDGGIGEIDGGGAVSIVAGSGNNYTSYVDLKLGNCGAAQVVGVGGTGGTGLIRNCEVYGTSGDGIVAGNNFQVDGCHVHNVGGIGIKSVNGAVINGCYIKNDGTNTMTHGISGAAASIRNNIISVSGGTIGILSTGANISVQNNSILSVSGTGYGIYGPSGVMCLIRDNLIDGFSGVGGKAFNISGSGEVNVLRDNAVHNCTARTAKLDPAYDEVFNVGEETLAGSLFMKSGSDTYANRLTYFAPAAVGAVQTGGLNGGAKGAVPYIAAPSSGGAINRGIMTGGRL